MDKKIWIILVVTLSFVFFVFATDSNSVLTITNSAPSVASVSLTPSSAYTNDTLICSNGVTSDSNGDEVTILYVWFNDSVVISGENSSSLSDTFFIKNNNVTCQITAYDGIDNGNSLNDSIVISNLAPSVDSIPDKQKDTDGTSWNYDANATDLDVDDGIDTLTWYSNNSIIDIVSSTGVISDTPIEDEQGFYTIRINVTDGEDWGEDVFIYTINDTTSPRISLIDSTATNESNLSQSFVYMNVSLDEYAFRNISYYLYDGDGLLNSYSTSIETTEYNFTLLSDGIYWYNSTSYDNYSNVNSTETRKITLDTSDPSITIFIPESATYNYNTSIPLNFSVYDLTLQSCWYNIDEGENISVSCYSNTTFDTSEATHTIYLYANDSLGHNGSSSVEFGISLSSPAINLNSPSNNYWFNRNNVFLNYTPLDSTLESCEIWTNTTGTWEINYTDFSPTNGSLNNYSFSVSDGLNYIWNVKCNDSASDIGWGISNKTFNVDSTIPLISYGSGVSNNTNTTANFISINISVTETNEDTIVFSLYGSSGIINSTYSTSGLRSINWTGLSDDIYYFNVTINDSAGNENSTETYLIRLDDTSPTIAIYSPLSQNYGETTLNFNYTSFDNVVGVDSCWYYIYYTNGTLAKSTETLSNCENDSFTLSSGDNDFTLTLFSKDLLNNLAYSSVTFGIRTESPVVVLYPSNNTHSPTILNHYFNFSVTTQADNISVCQLWTNTTGTWSLNQTIENPAYDGSLVNFTQINISEGNYEWNVWCNDSLNNYGWALNNNTFVVDLTYPFVSIGTITTTSGSQTISFDNQVNDTYLNSCKYSIYDSGNSIDGLNENVSFTCNSSTSATTTTYGTFTLKIYGTDFAGNENSTNKSFTTTALSPTSPGGGGGGTSGENTIPAAAIIQPKEDTNIYSNLSRAVFFARINDSCSGKLKNCILNENDKLELINILRNQGVITDIFVLDYWIDNYNEGKIESVIVTLKQSQEYGLVVSGVEILPQKFEVISPLNPDKIFPALFKDETFFTTLLNKEIKNCTTVEGFDVGFSCENKVSYAIISFKIPENSTFTSQLFQKEISFTSIDGEVTSKVFTVRVIRATYQLGLGLFLISGLIALGVYKRKSIEKIFKKRR